MPGDRPGAFHFIDLLKESQRGKLKIYTGMAAGVGKTYRMLVEAKELLENNIEVVAGFIETHGRKETAEQMAGIPVMGRKKVFYKGRELEEMDLEAILVQHPDVVLVDELAHTNIPGSINAKRWEDVMQMLEAGINVITTMNIQHLESINDKIEKITGINISERVPDIVINRADEIVNIDLTVEGLLQRLREGRIYEASKVEVAFRNFFTPEKLLQLRDLALKEVSRQLQRKIISTIPGGNRDQIKTVVSAISLNYRSAKKVIRGSSRVVSIYNSRWFTVNVQEPGEEPERIIPELQRHLMNNYKLAMDLGAEVVQLKGREPALELVRFAVSVEAALIVIGKPAFSLSYRLRLKNFFRELVRLTEKNNIDILMVSSNADSKK